MRNGYCYERPTWERPISGSGSTCWPTPTAQQDHADPETRLAAKADFGRNTITTLQPFVKMWPMPVARDGKGGKDMAREGGASLADTVHSHPDPTTPTPGDKSPRDLNPRFVGWLMGLPEGWASVRPVSMTSYECWATESSHWLRRLLGECSPEDWA